jgi:hypothetical protein
MMQENTVGANETETDILLDAPLDQGEDGRVPRPSLQVRQRA